MGANRDIYLEIRNDTDTEFELRDSNVIHGEWVEGFEAPSIFRSLKPGESKQVRLKTPTWSALIGVEGWLILKEKTVVSGQKRTQLGVYFDNPYVWHRWMRLSEVASSAIGLEFDANEEKFVVPNGAGSTFAEPNDPSVLPDFTIYESSGGSNIDVSFGDHLNNIPAGILMLSMVAGYGRPISFTFAIVPNQSTAQAKQNLIASKREATLSYGDGGNINSVDIDLNRRPGQFGFATLFGRDGLHVIHNLITDGQLDFSISSLTSIGLKKGVVATLYDIEPVIRDGELIATITGQIEGRPGVGFFREAVSKNIGSFGYTSENAHEMTQYDLKSIPYEPNFSMSSFLGGASFNVPMDVVKSDHFVSRIEQLWQQTATVQNTSLGEQSSTANLPIKKLPPKRETWVGKVKAIEFQYLTFIPR